MGEMDLACCFDGTCGMANRDLSTFDAFGALVIPAIGLILLALV